MKKKASHKTKFRISYVDSFKLLWPNWVMQKEAEEAEEQKESSGHWKW